MMLLIQNRWFQMQPYFPKEKLQIVHLDNTYWVNITRKQTKRTHTFRMLLWPFCWPNKGHIWKLFYLRCNIKWINQIWRVYFLFSSWLKQNIDENTWLPLNSLVPTSSLQLWFRTKKKFIDIMLQLLPSLQAESGKGKLKH